MRTTNSCVSLYCPSLSGPEVEKWRSSRATRSSTTRQRRRSPTSSSCVAIWVSTERTAVTYSNYRPLSVAHRARRQQSEGGGSEESDTAGSERGASPWAAHGDNSVRVAVQRPPDQEAVVTCVGDMAQDVAGWEVTARDDLSLRCLPQGKETLSPYCGQFQHRF